MAVPTAIVNPRGRGNHSRQDETRYSIYDCDVTVAYSVPWLMRMPVLLN
jgi:hypothetical protein